MTEVATFHASTRRSIFSDLASSPRPLNLAVYPDGAVQSLAPVVDLKVGAGRLLGASAPAVTGVDALVRVVLAESGRIEIRAGALPDKGPDAFPEFSAAFDEAEHVLSACLVSGLPPACTDGTVKPSRSGSQSSTGRPVSEFTRVCSFSGRHPIPT